MKSNRKIGEPERVDHLHAPIYIAAIRLGKHVYVEKPMAHTIEEALLMGEVADMQVVTQKQELFPARLIMR